MLQCIPAKKKPIFDSHRPNLLDVLQSEARLIRSQVHEILRDPMNRFVLHTSFPGDHRELEPPDPLPNSVVKWFIADGSVGFPHVRVGHRQDSKKENPSCASSWGFLLPRNKRQGRSGRSRRIF